MHRGISWDSHTNQAKTISLSLSLSSFCRIALVPQHSVSFELGLSSKLWHTHANMGRSSHRHAHTLTRVLALWNNMSCVVCCPTLPAFVVVIVVVR